jgi:hypothetical protein
MKTKTCPEIVRRVCGALGRSTVIHHEPTDTNKLGQSGVHTFADDVIGIVLASSNESQAYRNLIDFLHDGRLVK